MTSGKMIQILAHDKASTTCPMLLLAVAILWCYDHIVGKSGWLAVV